MTTQSSARPIDAASARNPALAAVANAAVRAIPPVWPLASSVAVNPFLGQSGESLAQTAARLGRVAGIAVTMPRPWYLERIASGAITDDDLAGALSASPHANRPASPEALKAAAATAAPPLTALPTVAELAADVSGTDWPGLIAERFGGWAAGYFDMGQALWAAPQGKSAYAAWRAVATHDLTPEILGLTGFATRVAEGPETAGQALAAAVARLGISTVACETYFHQLLAGLGGWAQFARYRLWQAELAGGSDTTLSDFLAIRLVWEQALLERYEQQIAKRWRTVCAAHAEPVAPTAGQIVDAILQDAADRAAQRALAQTFAQERAARPSPGRPILQTAFCIDVRSELFRRALESTGPGIETIGFAGFFGLALSHRRHASDVDEARCPVLLNPAATSRTTDCGHHDHCHEHFSGDAKARLSARAKRAWGRFKLAAVSSFAFVEAMGPVYAGKLLRDSFSLGGAKVPHDPAPRLDPALPVDQRAGMAATILRAMSLTDGFARIVLLAGHGATTVNNPHASALQCGACGGYSGEVNARLLAGLLNDPEVRIALAGQDIVIPDDTLFVGALHDTTTDAVTLYDADHPSAAHAADLQRVRGWLAAAGAIARGERALRLPRANGADDVAGRSRDWAEVRPEWGLAGCGAFIAAPRGRTAGRDLQGRSFLHSYDWRQDEGFRVLELILTAPVVVASWISLQYYGSTVAPAMFGAGNKLLHNVTGGIGVVEGNGGPLRVGLPWQSVHDGERYMHEPLRLSVVVEAPQTAIDGVLSRHPELRALFDNGWLHLFRLNEQGRMASRYVRSLQWTDLDASPAHEEPLPEPQERLLRAAC
ncbi:YbcC family protein [Azospirillum sp. B2RO_4]|uniref:YbcC family protein n=1 Tax=Azospirillum sp. B2RO_4 TaxID=3027796 RepID=UPI003DA7E7D8